MLLGILFLLGASHACKWVQYISSVRHTNVYVPQRWECLEPGGTVQATVQELLGSGQWQVSVGGTALVLRYDTREEAIKSAKEELARARRHK